MEDGEGRGREGERAFRADSASVGVTSCLCTYIAHPSLIPSIIRLSLGWHFSACTPRTIFSVFPNPVYRSTPPRAERQTARYISISL